MKIKFDILSKLEVFNTSSGILECQITHLSCPYKVKYRHAFCQSNARN